MQNPGRVTHHVVNLFQPGNGHALCATPDYVFGTYTRNGNEIRMMVEGNPTIYQHDVINTNNQLYTEDIAYDGQTCILYTVHKRIKFKHHQAVYLTITDTTQEIKDLS